MEISHLLEINEGELVTFSELTENGEKVRMWLNTPQGEYWGKPWWGNELVKFKHEPIDINIEVLLESSIISGLKRDLPSIKIIDIHVQALSVDRAFLGLVLFGGELIKQNLTGFNNAR